MNSLNTDINMVVKGRMGGARCIMGGARCEGSGLDVEGK